MPQATHLDMSELSVGVVENSPFFRRILRSLLMGFGIRTVVEAGNAAEGWDLLEEHRPDVLLVDWQLDGEDGTALLERIRRSPDVSIASSRFIFVSAHSDRRHVLLGAKLGANDFIVKPVSARLLYERIRRVVTTRSNFVRRNGRLEIVEKPFQTMPAAPPPFPAAERETIAIDRAITHI